MEASFASNQISSNNMGNVANPPWSYERMLKSFTRFIISSGLLINVLDYDSFLEFLNILNPKAARKRITQRTVLKVAKNEYVKLEKDLHSTFASLSHKVALGCDVWSNEGYIPDFILGQDLIHITVHWIDSDWTMQRRIIGFETLEPPICADSVSDHVKNYVNEWGISGKIFSVTLDDVCDYDDSEEDLRNVMHPVLDGRIFRVRCVCRALNLCVQDGLGAVSIHMNKIRDVVALPNEYPEHFLRQYVNLCIQDGLGADLAIDELTLYLQAPDQYIEHKMKDFDILEWWKSHEVVYPVLSTMARDLLTTSLSTLAPDCAFLKNKEKEITDKSYHYRGKILEVYTLKGLV